MSPPLKDSMKLQWKNNTIQYEIAQQIHTASEASQSIATPVNTPANDTSSPTNPTQIVTDDASWQALHNTIFHALKKWTTEPSANHLTYAWKNAIKAGMTEHTTWDQLKHLMNLDSFQDYYQFILPC